MIAHGVNGLLQNDPEDPHELASLLNQIRDPDFRQAMAAAARPSVDHLTWAALFDRAEALLAS